MLTKICPNCGENHLVNIYRDNADGKFVVMCECCGKTTDYYNTANEAIKAWNEDKTH